MSPHTHDSPIVHADLHDFPSAVIAASHQRPVLVDFWADWCAPCLTLAPVLEGVARDYASRLRIVKVEVDEGDNMKLAGHYKLRGFPTCILFIDGEEVDRFASHHPARWIHDFLDRNIAAQGKSAPAAETGAVT